MARHTEHLAELVAFYRDGLGLREVGGFRDHDGYDGVFLAVPGTGAHLEFTTGGGCGAPAPHPESLLVLYLGDHDAVRTVAARLGADPVEPANPYWARHALTFEDPEGFRVVLVAEPWAADGEEATPAPTEADGAIQVEPYTGPRAALRRLFELAEDSARELDAYIDAGRVLVARCADEIVGHLQIGDTDRAADVEVKSMAVDEPFQGRGVGRALMSAATGYAPGLEIDGIELRDRVWLDLRID